MPSRSQRENKNKTQREKLFKAPLSSQVMFRQDSLKWGKGPL